MLFLLLVVPLMVVLFPRTILRGMYRILPALRWVWDKVWDMDRALARSVYGEAVEESEESAAKAD